MVWHCRLCTFENRCDRQSKCEICDGARLETDIPINVVKNVSTGIESRRSKGTVQMNLFGGIAKLKEKESYRVDQTNKNNRSIKQSKTNFNSSCSDGVVSELDPKKKEHAFLPLHLHSVDKRDLSFSELKVLGKETLSNTFGIKKLRSLQPLAVTCALKKESQVVVMATGTGKSLCYQLPAVVLGGTTVVVSPLIALMNDQVRALTEKGVQAAVISSNNCEKHNKEIIERLLNGRGSRKQESSIGSRKPIALLYVTPEQVETNRFRDLLKALNAENNLTMFVVDEAHCLSAWGHDFRKSYMKLDYLRLTYPNVPLMACTATATPAVLQDIKKVLHLETSPCHVGSFDRPNIFYRVRYKDSLETAGLGGAMKDLLCFIKKQHLRATKDSAPCAGIIYVHKREETTEIASTIQNQCGIRAVPYHAGLKVEERNKAQEAWMSGEANVAVATVAFGMGIDLAHVRYVIHWTMPKSIEAFYQESGRAGRDGFPSFSQVYYSKEDASKFQFLLNKNNKSKGDSLDPCPRDMTSLNEIIQYCTVPGCRRFRLLKHFGQSSADSKKLCNKGCDYCVNPDRVKRAIESAATANDFSFHLGISNFDKPESPANYRRLNDFEDYGPKLLTSNGLIIKQPGSDIGCDLEYSTGKPPVCFEKASVILSKYEGLEHKERTGYTRNKKPLILREQGTADNEVEKGNDIVRIPKHLIPIAALNNSVATNQMSKTKTSAEYATEVERLRQELETVKKAAKESKEGIKCRVESSTDGVNANKRAPLAPPPLNFTSKRRK